MAVFAWPNRLEDTSHDAGSSMLEFVLALPFIWIVLAVCFNFGMALVERQRTLVTAREAGMRTAAGLDVSGDLERDILRARGMRASIESSEGRATCPAPGGGPDDSALHQAVIAGGGMLGRLSGSQVHEVRATGRPLVGRWLPQPRYRACFAVDSGTWT